MIQAIPAINSAPTPVAADPRPSVTLIVPSIAPGASPPRPSARRPTVVVSSLPPSLEDSGTNFDASTHAARLRARGMSIAPTAPLPIRTARLQSLMPDSARPGSSLSAGGGTWVGGASLARASEPPAVLYSWEDMVNGRPIPPGAVGPITLGELTEAATHAPRQRQLKHAVSSVVHGAGGLAAVAAAREGGGGGGLDVGASVGMGRNTSIRVTPGKPDRIAAAAAMTKIQPRPPSVALSPIVLMRNEFPKQMLRISDLRKKQAAAAARPNRSVLTSIVKKTESQLLGSLDGASFGSSSASFTRLVPMSAQPYFKKQRRTSPGAAAVMPSSPRTPGTSRDSHLRHQLGIRPSPPSTGTEPAHRFATPAAAPLPSSSTPAATTLPPLHERLAGTVPAWRHYLPPANARASAVGRSDALGISVETEEEYHFTFQHAARMQHALVENKAHADRDRRHMALRSDAARGRTPVSAPATADDVSGGAASGRVDLFPSSEALAPPRDLEVVLDRGGKFLCLVEAQPKSSDQLHKQLVDVHQAFFQNVQRATKQLHRDVAKWSQQRVGAGGVGEVAATATVDLGARAVR
ncbi:hypothetical protein GGF31_001087 [Allomyces arbusculus]|nr:hypothetical protein GGF31_001087 [Allomyces arbusculus]